MVIILFIFEAKTKHAFPITSSETFVYLDCYCIVCNTLDRVIHQVLAMLIFQFHVVVIVHCLL